jgi:hypothetical protein
MVCAGVCIYRLFDIRGLQQWRDAWGFSMQGVSINEGGKRMVYSRSLVLLLCWPGVWQPYAEWVAGLTL